MKICLVLFHFLAQNGAETGSSGIVVPETCQEKARFGVSAAERWSCGTR